MLPQHVMIDRAREICLADVRITAALLYGSFSRGEGDAYSDIEFVLFFKDDALPGLDRRAWVEQIAPLEVFFKDEVGHETAIFDNLVRGEFHFLAESDIGVVSTWKGSAWFPAIDSALVVDRNGELRRRLEPLAEKPDDPDTAETVESLVNNFMNWMLFGINVLQRGEEARSLEILSIARRDLLKMVRIRRGLTTNYISPAHFLERDLSLEDYSRVARCTCPLDSTELRRAYRETWIWGRELIAALMKAHNLPKPLSLLRKIQRLVIKTTAPVGSTGFAGRDGEI